MADHDSVTPQRCHLILPLSISRFPVTPRKTKQYPSRVIAVVPASTEGERIPADKIVMFPEDSFKLKKALAESDVDGRSGLSLVSECVEKYILPFMDSHDAQLCRTGAGKEFPALDMSDVSVHSLVLKKWKKSGFAVTGNWVPDFVIRKDLETGDQVGIGFSNGWFLFKLLKKRGN